MPGTHDTAATNDARVVHVVALNISTFIYSSAIARAGMSSSSDDGDELSLSAFVRSCNNSQFNLKSSSSESSVERGGAGRLFYK